MADLTVLPKREAIYCHHEDVVAYIHGLEIAVSLQRQEIEVLKERLAKLACTLELRDEHHRWLDNIRPGVESLLASSQWLTTTRKVLLFVAGALIGIVSFWHSVREALHGGWSK